MTPIELCRTCTLVRVGPLVGSVADVAQWRMGPDGIPLRREPELAKVWCSLAPGHEGEHAFDFADPPPVGFNGITRLP